jgi:EmrB/QacA subfamily drug resistance transporter
MAITRRPNGKRAPGSGQDPGPGQSRGQGRGQGWALALASVASFMVALDMLVVATALNVIRRDLGASIGELEWTVNAYTLTFAVLLMTAAAIGDRFGRRRVFAVGLGVFVVASAGCALAPGVGWLIAARAVQGTGAAMIMPLALAVLNAAVPPQRRGWAMGVFGGVTALAVVVGPVLGGAITQGIAWQWIFWLNVPIGLVVIALVLRRLDESHGPRADLDFPGLVLGTAAVLGLVWGLVRGSSAGWGSPEVAGALAGGGLLVVAFTRWELRARAPMLPMRLFASRGFSAGSVAIFFLNASVTGAVFFMAQFLQVSLGQDPLDSGLRLLPWGVAPFLIAPRAGRLADQIGDRPLIVSGLMLQAAALAGIAVVAGLHLGYGEMIAPMFISGAGIGLAIPAATKAVIGAVPPGDIGKASGVFSTMRQLGGAFGVAILAAVFTAAGSYASPAAFSDGFAPALAAAAGLALAGGLAGLVLPGRRNQAESAPADARLGIRRGRPGCG